MLFDQTGVFRIMLNPPGVGRILLVSPPGGRLFNP
jgi:hypothetical protein